MEIPVLDHLLIQHVKFDKLLYPSQQAVRKLKYIYDFFHKIFLRLVYQELATRES